jgi:hypothetical protein
MNRNQNAGGLLDVLNAWTNQVASSSTPSGPAPEMARLSCDWNLTLIREGKAARQGRNGTAMKSIIAGVVLIGIGFSLGDSIFLGNFGVLSFVFDGLGLFWIGKGIYGIWRAKQQS